MPALILARLALVEARRGGLLWLAAFALAGAIALGGFFAALAITEGRLVQTALAAAILRICAVFLLAAQVVASTRREIDERRLEFTLALPVGRSTQYLGRLAGFGALGLLLAIAFSLPLFLWAPAAPVALWGVSLAFELALVASAALFFAMTLAQHVAALAATAALYLLARSMSALQAIASGPLAGESTWHELARRAVDGVALVLPALDRVTRTEWLLYGAPDTRSYAAALGAMVLYILLLAAAGLFDFARRSA